MVRTSAHGFDINLDILFQLSIKSGFYVILIVRTTIKIIGSSAVVLKIFSQYNAVLFNAPQIPAGMTGFRWNPLEWDRNPLE